MRSIAGPTFINVTQSKADPKKTVRFFIQGIDVDVKLAGSVNYFWQRSVTLDHMKIRNLTINVAITPDWIFQGVFCQIQDFDLVVEEPLVSRALYSSHELLLSQINQFLAKVMPDAITTGIAIFNETIRTSSPTQTNNPF